MEDEEISIEGPTRKEVTVNDKKKRAEEGQWSCSVCPPWRGENTIRMTGGKRGRKKPKYKNKNKKRGRAMKRINSEPDMQKAYSQESFDFNWPERIKTAGTKKKFDNR